MTGAVTPARRFDKERNLETALAREMFPTPSASLGEHGGLVTPAKAREGGTLIEALSARLRPTRTARDWKSTSPGMQGNARPLSEAVGAAQAEYRALIATMTEADVEEMAALGGPLNPDWVEWLMGFPIGWTRMALD